MDQDAHLLSTSKLVKEYRQRRVVNGVSIYVDSGEIVGLLGPNGAGKTTTFNIVVGLVRPDEGDVRFREKEITRLPMHQVESFRLRVIRLEVLIRDRPRRREPSVMLNLAEVPLS